MKTKLFGKTLAIAGAVVAAAAVSISIYQNPPAIVKARELDHERLQGLQQIDFAVKAYYRAHHTLPDRLDDIDNNNELSSRTDWRDPVTQQPYQYTATGKATYKLCAEFGAESEKDESYFADAFRSHHKGRDCFEQEINSD